MQKTSKNDDSNTTLVKVKCEKHNYSKFQLSYSNTTLVKVKCGLNKVPQSITV